MKTVVCKRYGEPDVLKIENVDKPIVEEDEVLVKIMASSISKVDIAFREGKPLISRAFTGLTKPKYSVPGDCITGVIEVVGSKVTAFEQGDKIYGHTGLSFGGHGEYLSISQNEAIIRMPDGMTFVEAAAFAYSAMTALPFVRDHALLQGGKTILVNGAAGGIGTFAVQMAKHYGAKVVGVCGASNGQLLKEIGVDEVIDYTKESFCNRTNSFDVIFDAVGKSSFKKSKSSLRENGLYLTTVPDFSGILAMMTTKNKSKKARFVATGLRKNPEKINDLGVLSELYKKGAIKAIIDRTYDLKDIVEAHRYVGKGHNKGNVILLNNE